MKLNVLNIQMNQAKRNHKQDKDVNRKTILGSRNGQKGRKHSRYGKIFAN